MTDSTPTPTQGSNTAFIKISSYFEVSAKAGLGYDLDTGEPVETYLCVATEHKMNLTDSEIELVRQMHKNAVCDQLDLPPEYLKEISEQEYLFHTEEED